MDNSGFIYIFVDIIVHIFILCLLCLFFGRGGYVVSVSYSLASVS
jgi:hypothetical protein